MATYGKTVRASMAAALLLAGLTTAAQGFVPGGLSGFGGGGRSMAIIKGQVLCAGCELDEVSKAQPSLHHLYQLTHQRGRVVMQVRTVNGSDMWETPLSPRFMVRSKDSVFQQLTAEENLMKDVEITGTLSTTQTLDVFGVTVSG
jgi:hypothetical protein